MSNSVTGRRRVVVQYVALAAAWGASFLFIKVGLEGLSPVQVVLGRMVVTLGLVCALTRHGCRPTRWCGRT